MKRYIIIVWKENAEKEKENVRFVIDKEGKAWQFESEAWATRYVRANVSEGLDYKVIELY